MWAKTELCKKLILERITVLLHFTVFMKLPAIYFYSLKWLLGE